MTQVQRALRQGVRRSVDPVTIPAGMIETSRQPRPYCMTDAEAQAAKEAAQAKRRLPSPVTYAEAHLIDRMWNRGQLNDQQHDTATRLYALFLAAGLEPRMVADIGERLAKSREIDEGTANSRAAWNAVVARVQGKRQELLHDLCLGRHPGLHWLATLQASLDDIQRFLARKKRVDGAR